MSVVDLRSDTVTRPTAAMREVIATAVVGDDVFGEDPTINALQERAASMFGHKAALFVPSGTMANQIALMSTCRPGDDVIAASGAHAWFYETGAAAALGGVQFTLLDDPIFDAESVEAAIKPDNHHMAPTQMVIVENTHNRSGGRVFPLSQIKSIGEVCGRFGLRLHMDGARVCNAAVASGVTTAELGGAVDSLSVCLSKGLGCPVGSVLIGDEAFIHRAHRYRKMLGGGMRQAGFLAAAGLYALEHNVARLAEDHRRAAHYLEGVLGASSVSVPAVGNETNIVVFDIDPARMTGAGFVEAASARGMLTYAIGPQRIRAVFHLDVDDDDLTKAIEVSRAVLD